MEQRLAHSVLGEVPVVGADLRVHALTGSTTVLAAGVGTALWSGMKVFRAAETAADVVWAVPRRLRGFLRTRIRALELLLVVGGGALTTTALGVVQTAAANLGPLASAGLLMASLATDFAFFWLAFRLLAPADTGWRGLLPGAAVAATGWGMLQQLGGVYVAYVLRTASATYGTFATVIGLLSYTYLSVMLALVAMEVNVVAVRRLWPRSFSLLDAQPATAADDRAAALRESSLSRPAETPHRFGALADGVGRDSRSPAGALGTVTDGHDPGWREGSHAPHDQRRVT
jgi:uncharacterized BrkB/YihY/UPF0761 family membrane protein